MFLKRRQSDCVGAFDHCLLDLQKHRDRLLDVVFADQQHVVDLFTDQRQGQGAW